jgi:DNA polymerase V
MHKDVAVLSRVKKAGIGDIVMAVLDGEFTIGQLTKGENGNVILQLANPDYMPIEIKDGMDFQIWGIFP